VKPVEDPVAGDLTALDRLPTFTDVVANHGHAFIARHTVSLNVYSPQFGREMTAVMESDLRHATPYTFERWLARPTKERIGETVVRPWNYNSERSWRSQVKNPEGQ